MLARALRLRPVAPLRQVGWLADPGPQPVAGREPPVPVIELGAKQVDASSFKTSPGRYLRMAPWAGARAFAKPTVLRLTQRRRRLAGRGQELFDQVVHQFKIARLGAARVGGQDGEPHPG